MYSPKHEAYSHQTEALGILSDKSAFALFLDMGTGKTKIILDEFQEECSKEDGLTDLLIVAPGGSYSNWVTELEEHLDPELYLRLVIAKWKSGSGKAMKDVDELLEVTEQPRVLIVNVESLSTVLAAKVACINFLKSKKATAVVDESTSLKNVKAKRTKFLIRYVANLAKRRRILSGLPSPNSPLDLYSQFEFLDSKILGFPSFNVFKSTYAITKRVQFPGARFPTDIVLGYRDIDRLHNQIKPYSYRKTKDECLDLPPKVYMPPRLVEMTPEQKKVYQDIKDKSTSELEKGVHINAPLVITKMLRLHQILCGHVVDEDGVLREVPTNRIDALLEVLGEHSGKAVIWANYNHSVEAVVEAISTKKDSDKNLIYGEKAVAKFYGNNAGTRLDDERRWKTDPECRFLVASQGAGSLGNTWVEADLVVYYSNDFSLEHRMQSEDRAHRSGQTKSVTYVDIMTPNSVDQKIVNALRNKINLSSEITGDDYKEWLI